MLNIHLYEVKWALESITTNKASGGDGIPVELFQILKDDAVKHIPQNKITVKSQRARSSGIIRKKHSSDPQLPR